MKKRLMLGMIVVSGFLLLFVISPSLAIYRNSNNVDGSIVSAEWDVSLNQEGIEDHLSIVPNGTTANYTLNIRSSSEVDVVYSIVLSNLPNHVTVLLDGANAKTTTQNNDTITFSEIGTILYSDLNHEKQHVLTFRAETGATFVNNQTIDVDVTVRQSL